MKFILLCFALNACLAHAQSLPDLVGDYHNDGLDYAMPLIKGKALSGALAINTAHAYTTKLPNWDFGEPDLKYVTELEHIIKNPSTAFRYAIEFCERIVGSRNLPSYFSEMRAVEQVLKTVRRGTPEAIIASLKNDLLALKSKTKNAEAQALISIAIASTDYWGAYPSYPSDESLPWIEADAAGYLIGWGTAYLEDVVNDRDSGSGSRIRRGLSRAVAASMGRWF